VVAVSLAFPQIGSERFFWIFWLRRLGYSVPRGTRIRKTAIEINCEPLAAPVLELVRQAYGVAVHCPRDLARGEGGVRAAARPGESDLLLRSGVARGPIAEPKISRKIVAGQPQLSRFGEKLAELPPTGDQVALFRPRLGRLERTCINEPRSPGRVVLQIRESPWMVDNWRVAIPVYSGGRSTSHPTTPQYSVEHP
jgi:hypothetical protein